MIITARYQSICNRTIIYLVDYYISVNSWLTLKINYQVNQTLLVVVKSRVNYNLVLLKKALIPSAQLSLPNERM